MRFRGRRQCLCFTTLSGVVTDYKVTTYNCFIRDRSNKVYNFEAYGLECVTGSLSTIDSGSIKRLFPDISEAEVQSLVRAPNVDFLIGMSHPS